MNRIAIFIRLESHATVSAERKIVVYLRNSNVTLASPSVTKAVVLHTINTSLSNQIENNDSFRRKDSLHIQRSGSKFSHEEKFQK